MRARLMVVAVVVLAGCANETSVSDQAGVSFPVHQASGPQPLALLDGTLDVREGCVYIRAENGERFVGLWPRAYHPERVEDEVRIVDELGEVLAVEGGPIRVGGCAREASEVGGFDALDAWFAQIGGTALPRGCGELFWQVSGIEPT